MLLPQLIVLRAQTSVAFLTKRTQKMWLGLQNSHLLVKIPCRRPYVTQTTTFWWRLFSNKKRNRSFLRNLNQENDFNELDDRPESWKSKYWRRVIMNDKLSSSDCLHESSRNDVVEADKKIVCVFIYLRFETGLQFLSLSSFLKSWEEFDWCFIDESALTCCLNLPNWYAHFIATITL